MDDKTKLFKMLSYLKDGKQRSYSEILKVTGVTRYHQIQIVKKYSYCFTKSLDGKICSTLKITSHGKVRLRDLKASHFKCYVIIPENIILLHTKVFNRKYNNYI